MFKFLKTLFADKESIQPKSNQTDVESSINSEYRLKYGTSYDYVFNYDEGMARYIARNDVPKYAIDWLVNSIKSGVSVEFVAVSYSIEKGVPYLCDTEEETWLFEKEENPIKDSTEGIYSALLQYKYGSLANENKMNYWLNRLISLADNGNMMAQGLICWRCGVIFQDGRYDGVLPQNIWEELKKSYEEKILNYCNAGEPYAQLAVAKYNRDIDEEQKEELYLSAIERGLTDACYYYAKFLNQKRYVANGMTINIPTYGTEEWQVYMKDELSLYKKGAELNNGVMSGYCQFRLGDMYACGDGGVFKDAAMAQIWFKKSFGNGYEGAKHRIEL